MYVSSRKFHWDKEKRQFSADISDARIMFGKVYPDSYDIGFIMISARTGLELKFYLDREEHIHDEVVAWHFKALTRNPDLTDITAVVFND